MEKMKIFNDYFKSKKNLYNEYGLEYEYNIEDLRDKYWGTIENDTLLLYSNIKEELEGERDCVNELMIFQESYVSPSIVIFLIQLEHQLWYVLLDNENFIKMND